MEQLFKIYHSCGSLEVEGLEPMTEEQADAWMQENNEFIEETEECGDTVKYIRKPI